MKWLTELGRRLHYLFQRRRWEDDLADEIRLHMDLRAADKAAQGITAQDVKAQLKRGFGSVAHFQEESRRVWGWAFWDALRQDVRYGMRTLVANPGFAAAAILSLALGIGANTAIFSILNAVMLRSLPVEDPRQLVQLVLKGYNSGSFTNPIWEQVRDHQRAFSGAFAYSLDRFDLADGGESHFAQGIWVSGDFFRVLGVPALRGRILGKEDDLHGCGRSGPVAVISYAFWQGNFGGNPNVLGNTVRLDRHVFEIVGVTPPWFKGLDVDRGYDVAIPIGCEPILHTDRSALNHRSWWWLRMIGRLKPGFMPVQAEAQLNSIAPAINRATLPPNWDAEGKKRYLRRAFGVRPAATGFSATGTQYKKALFTLMTVVGLVLLIACANIANLLLARSAARQREISVRLAIGASRSRVIRQLLTESFLLSIVGAAGGILFASWGSRLLLRLLSQTNNELEIDLAPDLHLLAFTAGVAILTGVLFGLAPALRATNIGPHQVLKENARGTLTGSSQFTMGKALVTGQVALSLALLVGAGLFLETLLNLLTIDPGFNSHNVLLVTANLPANRVQKAQRSLLFDKILSQLRGLQGVRSAASSMLTPVSHRFWNDDVHPEGYQPKPVEDDTLVYMNRISSDYFKTLGTPMFIGRDFSERDTLASPNVMIVGEFTARHFWGGANPIGKTIAMDTHETPGKRETYRVIGVVKDAKYGDLDEQTLKTAFVPYSQDADPSPRVNYELRSDSSVESLTPAIRSAFAAVNKDVTLEINSLEVQISDSLIQPRLVALLSSFFGFLALCLATIGLYGVISYAAAKRRGEIGIRMALGAARTSVVWLVLRDVVFMIAIGTILGLATSLAAGRLIKSLLFDVKPADPVTFVIAVAVLGVSAAIAGYLPARRAANMDPMSALREE